MDEKIDLQVVAKKVYELTWEGKLWGKEGAIVQSYKKFVYLKELGRGGDGASALSSVYYTAIGNASAQFRLASFPDKVIWLFRWVWAMMQALDWSGYAEKQIGFSNMTHGQLDVRASILAKWHFFAKAERYLLAALNRSGLTRDSQALILVKLGEVRDRRGEDDGGEFFGGAHRIVDIKATTRVRVLKALGSHMLRKKKSRPIDYRDKALWFFCQSLEIAEREGLGDQIVKIHALMDKAGGRVNR